MDSRFWRWVVIHIDAPYVTREIAETFFHASRKNRIRIYICYSGPPFMNPDRENRRVMMAMECARPHLSRCSEFNLRILYRSSTVIASRYLDGTYAPSRGKLSLISSITDSTECFGAIKLICPRLLWIWLDAQSLVDFIFTNTGHTSFPQSNIILHATRYRPHGIPNSLLAKSFAHAVAIARRKVIVTFTLTDVEFSHNDHSEVISSISLNTRPQEEEDHGRELIIRLTDMEGPSISSLLNHIMADTLSSSLISIDNCDLAGFELHDRLPFQCRLSLDNIRSTSSLTAITSQWDGSVLLLRSCAGFNRDFLYILGEDTNICPNMKTLAIDGLHWSLGELIHMCEARHNAGRRLERLEVEGDIPVASGEELELLEMYVDEVDWSPGYDLMQEHADMGRRGSSDEVQV
ncbi:hypothetical protein CONPUDRAFT_154035 [Coniophora puteana RWD-64-598 SS2]|uniref:F-box domain-containing protein n=1 Tax=Coniophora puteana (strain RWD-64-598) TaxID=741705 RepID=A0A5M3MS65_CONPW|nr:uncharacterized protein CONPUDRAFT_154035 [Coniophora puteana RWD-64-598 SS2]EIW81495.1 hypothetical protein CONPUDRAFT_154035 [Coniophora puteana RWD-64-598 SS2]